MSDCDQTLEFILGGSIDLSKTDCCNLREIRKKLVAKMLCEVGQAGPTVQVKDERWEIDRYLRAIRQTIQWIDEECGDDDEGPAFFVNSREGCERFMPCGRGFFDGLQ